MFSDIVLYTDATYWNRLGQQLLKDELDKKPVKTKAKNVILFLGDGLQFHRKESYKMNNIYSQYHFKGLSMSTIASARIYKGQTSGGGKTGEEESLTFESFPFTALAKV